VQAVKLFSLPNGQLRGAADDISTLEYPARRIGSLPRLVHITVAALDLVILLMSMARLTFPSSLELNRREGSFKAAPVDAE
jgi:hypothetical protein